MGALLDEAALLEDEDPVGIAECAQAVGDCQGGAAAGQDAKRLLDRLFRFGIDAARGLVEDENSGIEEQGPRDRGPLLFAAGEA